MTESSAERFVSRKGNETAILILPNVIKVMVVFIGQLLIETWQNLIFHL